MSKHYFMGIDNGGSATKCVIYDQDGQTVGSSSIRIPMSKTKEGYTERTAQDIWEGNCRVISDALERSGLSGPDISCVSVCGYGGGLGMLDSKGNPIASFIVSTDSRAVDLLTEMRHNGITNEVYQYTLQNIWAGQPAALLPWYKRYRPEIYARCAHVVMIKDYIRYRLTGVLGTDGTDASNTSLLNIRRKCFDRNIFKLLGIEDCYSCFPETFLSPNQTAGFVTAEAAAKTGLRRGTPVATGLYDVASCCLGSGILDEETLCLIVGTWSICGHITPLLENCLGKNITLLSFLDGFWFLEESSPTSASNLDWFVEHFYSKMLSSGGGNIYSQCDRIVASLDPADSDLIFLPYIYGSNTIASAKGCFFNLAGHNNSEHMLLAIYEGILFSLLYHVKNLYGDAVPQLARLSGGASRSEVWSQMISDMLSIPIEVAENEELGALGCAMCASIASGVHHDYDDASAHMNRIRKKYIPDKSRSEIYRKKYALYQSAVKSLDAFYFE